MSKIYGYLRISTKHQDISRQRVNILREYPTAILYEETHSGGDYNGCVILDKLLKIVESGDSIVFDSVSRFSRDNVTGPLEYKRLFKDNINLVFLNEPYINTDNYRKALDIAIPRTGTLVFWTRHKFHLIMKKEYQNGENPYQNLHKVSREASAGRF